MASRARRPEQMRAAVLRQVCAAEPWTAFCDVAAAPGLETAAL